MYIRRKVFSLLNVEGEDRYFSTTDYKLGENGEVRLFAEKEEKKEKKKKVALKDVSADDGIKRSVVATVADSGGSLWGRKKGREEADRADAEGASDEEIVRRAGKVGMKEGAKFGAAVGAGTGLLMGGPIGAVVRSGVGAGVGAIGGRNAARVQTKARLAKRGEKESK